jgi:hypothetical protein
MDLTQSQMDLVEADLNISQFLSGPAGSGKTTVGTERLKFILQDGTPGKEILVLVPQRNLGSPYQETLKSLSLPPGSVPIIATYGGLARRYIDLFWPLFQASADKLTHSNTPIFLTLESTLYFMSLIVDPLIEEEGLFSSVTIQRNRLYSQILDNLNKSAVHGFPHSEISRRLKSSWIGDPAQSRIFDDAQLVANLFRDYCYEHNLMDYSLQIETFTSGIKKNPFMFDYFHNTFSHLIYDNCEEDIPVCHDFVTSILPGMESALIIYDEGAGYRQFLGASPQNAYLLSGLCKKESKFNELFTSSKEILKLCEQLISYVERNPQNILEITQETPSSGSLIYKKHLTEISTWVAHEIDELLQAGVDPEEIVILSPYLSDTLRFVLVSELENYKIPAVTHRPSRPLRDEPASICLLSLASLAHPAWKYHPSVHELSICLMQSLSDLDLTRANIIAKQILPHFSKTGTLPDFDTFPGDIQSRISYFSGTKYQLLVDWIRDYQEESTLHLDHFMIRIFGEILSQQGFGFFDDFNKAEITDHIIESVKKFRNSAGEVLGLDQLKLGAEYHKMVRAGVLANQYLSSWNKPAMDSVFISPAYTFLLRNYAVNYQFWLDVGSRGWYERIFQPLTHPHVLHRDWNQNNQWTDAEELHANHNNLSRLITGLARRCKQRIYFCLSETDELGFEQNSLLIEAISSVLSKTTNPDNSNA